MVVSAEGSGDVNDRPLSYHWVVLRGDSAKITIKPTNKTGSAVDITVAYQPRQPIAPGSNMESNRVDIGLFVHNGAYYSAPAFICFFTLDDEARTYDPAGRPLEIGYGMGEVSASVSNWPAMFGLLKPPAGLLGATLLEKSFTDAQLAEFSKASEEYKAAASAVAAAQETLKKAALDNTTAKKDLDAAAKAVDDVLNKGRPGLPAGVRGTIEGALRAMANDPNFYPNNAKSIRFALQGAEKTRQPDVAAARQRLVGYGLLKNTSDDAFVLTPILAPGAAEVTTSSPASGPASSPAMPGPVHGLTAFEKCLLQQFNAAILNDLLTAAWSTPPSNAITSVPPSPRPSPGGMCTTTTLPESAPAGRATTAGTPPSSPPTASQRGRRSDGKAQVIMAQR